MSLEKEMATHSSILTWRMPWTEEPGGLQSMGLQESDTTKPPPPLQWEAQEGTREKPLFAKLERSPCSNKGPAHPNLKKKKNYFKKYSEKDEDEAKAERNQKTIIWMPLCYD